MLIREADMILDRARKMSYDLFRQFKNFSTTENGVITL